MKILIALEPAGGNEIVLEAAASRPWPANSTFKVVSVVEPSHLWTSSDVVENAARSAEEVVRSGVATLPNATAKVLFGDPRREIPEHAARFGADFILTGARHSSVKRIGGVASGILRRSGCSVEIVRPRLYSGVLQILLATDGSESSQVAARSIAERPWPVGTIVRVLSAVELILPTGYLLFEPPSIDNSALETAREQAMKHAQEAVDSAIAVLAAAGLSTSESISVLLEPPKTIILQEAADSGADLIVVGSHGRHGIDRLLLGSTSEAVATHAECSVEVIRGGG
jgi:nucleotide-binding universal stress UspA family protein